MKANLQYCAEMIPTLSTQLRIIASVKASTPDDASVSQYHLYNYIYIYSSIPYLRHTLITMQPPQFRVSPICMYICIYIVH